MGPVSDGLGPVGSDPTGAGWWVLLLAPVTEQEPPLKASPQGPCRVKSFCCAHSIEDTWASPHAGKTNQAAAGTWLRHGT